MVEVRSIPLGGTDYAGNPLPPQGQFYVPGGQASPQGSDPTGGWAPFQPPQPQGQPAQAQSDQDNGGWPSYTPQEPKEQRQIGTGEAALRGAAHGLTFGFYPAIAGAAAGAKAALTGEGDFSTAYDQTRQQEEEAQQQSEKQHPAAYIASDIAANIPTMFIPGIGAGKAAVTAAEALPRIGQAIRTGAVAGGLFGAGEQTSQGASPIEIAKGAGGGAVAGGALGGVLGSGIEGISKVGSRVASIVRGQRDPELEAQRLAAGALKTDENQVRKIAADKGAIQARKEAGLDVRNADIGGGTTKALLRTATNIAPEARDVVADVVNPRFAQQGGRIGRFIRSQFNAGDNDIVQSAIKQAADKANDPAYATAYRAGAKMPFTPELQRLTGAPSIMHAIQGAVAPLKDRGIVAGYKLPRRNPFYFNAERRRLELAPDKNGNTVLPELAFWDQVVRNLNGRIESLLKTRPTRARDVIQLKNELTAELDKIVPEYAQARATASAFFKARDAVEAGANFVRDTSISNAMAARVLSKMNHAERELFRRGFASELARLVEQTGFNRDVLNSMYLNNGPAKQRILLALGQKDAGRLEALLRIEGIVDRTRKALGNSTTIQQGSDAGKFAGTLATIEGLKGAFNPAYLVAIPLIWAGRQTAKQIDERVFTRVAELLMSEDPTVLARGLDIAAKNPTVRTALRYASDLSARQLVNLLGPSGVGSGALAIADHFKGKAIEAPANHPNNYDDNYQGYQGGTQAVP